MNVYTRQRGGGRSSYGRGSGTFPSKCFNWKEVWHQYYRCPEKEVDYKKVEKRVNLTQGGVEEGRECK